MQGPEIFAQMGNMAKEIMGQAASVSVPKRRFEAQQFESFDQLKNFLDNNKFAAVQCFVFKDQICVVYQEGGGDGQS